MTNASWRRWYALNLPEELDLPGEYVIDATEGKLDLYPPAGKQNSLCLSVVDQPLVAIKNRSNVTIERTQKNRSSIGRCQYVGFGDEL